MIRDTFTRIHRSFADLEVSEWVPVPGHPDHPPLDYQELLGLEGMGIVDYPIGKLRIKVNLRQLLDGYESVEVRHRQRHSDKWGDREFWDDGFPGSWDREPNPKPAIPQERTQLRQFVLELPDPQVDAVIFNLDPPKGNVPPSSSPKSERVTALFDWLESPIGPGLAALRSALANVV